MLVDELAQMLDVLAIDGAADDSLNGFGSERVGERTCSGHRYILCALTRLGNLAQGTVSIYRVDGKLCGRGDAGGNVEVQ